MQINLSRLHWPVNALGFGNRIGIWFQGCSIGCAGCCSLDTWDNSDINKVELNAVIDWIKKRPLDEIDGITISGGEPFDQPEALHELCQEISTVKFTKKIDILVYTGYPYKKIKEYINILNNIDLLISEPFVNKLDTAYLRGSSNQKIHLLSEIGKERYGQVALSQLDNKIQVHYDGEQIWMIGIPHKHKQEELLTKLKNLGIEIKKPSWVS